MSPASLNLEVNVNVSTPESCTGKWADNKNDGQFGKTVSMIRWLLLCAQNERNEYTPQHTECPGHGTAWHRGSSSPHMLQWCLGSHRASSYHGPPNREMPRVNLHENTHTHTRERQKVSSLYRHWMWMCYAEQAVVSHDCVSDTPHELWTVWLLSWLTLNKLPNWCWPGFSALKHKDLQLQEDKARQTVAGIPMENKRLIKVKFIMLPSSYLFRRTYLWCDRSFRIYQNRWSTHWYLHLSLCLPTWASTSQHVTVFI